MNTQDFICACLHCYKGACEYMDELQDSFDVTLTEDDVRAAIEYHTDKPLQIGNALIALLFERVKQSAQELYPHHTDQIESLFEYYADDYASSVAFNGVRVNNWNELIYQINKLYL